MSDFPSHSEEKLGTTHQHNTYKNSNFNGDSIHRGDGDNNPRKGITIC